MKGFILQNTAGIYLKFGFSGEKILADQSQIGENSVPMRTTSKKGSFNKKPLDFDWRAVFRLAD